MRPQGLENTLWSFATLGLTIQGGLLAAVGGRIAATAAEHDHTSLALATWALGKLAHRPSDALAVALRGRMTQVSAAAELVMLPHLQLQFRNFLNLRSAVVSNHTSHSDTEPWVLGYLVCCRLLTTLDSI